MRSSRLAVSAAIVVAATLVAWLLGAQLAHGIRRGYAWLGPGHTLEVALALIAGSVLVSFLPTGGLGRRLETTGSTLTAWICAIPTVVVLTAIVAAAALVAVSLGEANTVPNVLGDELIYVDLAKGIAVHGEPLLRGQRDIGRSILYPLFLSPAYALAPDGAAAFRAAKAMDAAVMSLTAVPAYYFGRRVLSHGWSLVAAVAAISVPWLAYSALALTEPLFYPVFVTFALLLSLTLERPTAWRQIALLGLLGALVAIRPQALAVAGSVVLAVLLKAVWERPVALTVRRYWLTLTVIALAVAIALAAAAVGIQVPTSGYSAVFTSGYGVVGVAKWTLWNLGVYLFAVGVTALVALPLALVGLLRRRATPRQRAFGISALSLFVGIVASVALLSASPFGLGILHERNLFYVTPLVITCFLFWLAEGRAKPLYATVAAVGVALALAASVPAGVLDRTNNIDSPTAAFLRGLQGGTLHAIPSRGWLVLICAAGAGALLVARRQLLLLATVALAFAAVSVTADVRGSLSTRDDHGLAWVDRALPSGATATLVHVDLTRPALPCAETAEYEQQGLLVWTEFFNTKVDRLVHVYGERGRDYVPAPLLTVEPDGVLLENGKQLRPEYALVDTRQPIAGAVVARFDLPTLGSQYQDGASLTLWRVTPPLRLQPIATPIPPRADGRGC